MMYEKRTIKTTGESYYSFVRYDVSTRKRVRMSREETRNRFGRDILTEEDAKKCLGLLRAEVDSTKERFQRRLDWQEKYYRFGELLRMYKVKRQRKAPNSWRHSVHYLSYYVLPFFLTIKKLDNILLWPDHYEAFRTWLETEASLVRKPEQKISFASRNHCVKALNTFMRHLKEDGIIRELRILEAFDGDLMNEKTADDLVSDEEMESLVSRLHEQGHHTEADYYRTLFFTGMRFNEALGISFADIFPNQVEGNLLSDLLKKNKIHHFGYILLESQPAAENRSARDPVTLRVPRKPLKGRKKICEKNSRIVPITDERVWISLVERSKQQFRLWKNGAYGTDQKDYLIFDGLNKATSMTRLKQAYEALGIKCRTWHCLRHTRGTMLFAQTHDRELAKIWLGHTSDRVFSAYLHCNQQMVRKVRRPAVRKCDDFDAWMSGVR